MKLIFQKEIDKILPYYVYNSRTGDEKELATNKIGVVVLEKEPHARTLLNFENSGKNRVFLPYVQFYVKYSINDENKYVYHGIGYDGLRVSFSKNSIKSKKDIVVVPPQDAGRNGFVCTPHYEENGFNVYDHKIYDDLESLYKEVIGVYWGLVHEYIKWKNFSQEEVLERCESLGRCSDFFDYINEERTRQHELKINEEDFFGEMS
ncbi:MAG: hypothetical protein EKK64_06705 [Neisseriaceae bacterium]|nr:MAG: hypothetical protein EKK64_06705 [Neisseriaceae bacterium]